jgi:proline iminopeptidase
VRKEELVCSRGMGAALIFPDLFKDFVNYLPQEDRGGVFQGYYKIFKSDDRERKLAAARAWNTWELSISAMQLNTESFDKLKDDDWSLAHATLECHYFIHGAWLEEGQILKKSSLDKIRHIQGKIINPMI